MSNKDHRSHEHVLGRVIRILEADDEAVERGGESALALLRSYHGAVVDLLAHGPLVCAAAVRREREETRGEFPLQPSDVLVLRAELLQLLRSTVRGAYRDPLDADSGRPGTPIHTGRGVGFAPHLIAGRVILQATGDTRDLVVLQMVLLMQLVGLANVHECSAPDCQRLFVKFHRRIFCSVQCQKRINTRLQRQNARRTRERALHRRRLQRIATKGLTGGLKAPQVASAVRRNARQSTAGKKRA